MLGRIRHLPYRRSRPLPNTSLPESLDEYVGAENPVRFIDAFVDGLHLTAAGFIRVASKVTGRPGYAPRDLLKLYIYGYLNRVRSSRRLEAEAHRNVEVICGFDISQCRVDPLNMGVRAKRPRTTRSEPIEKHSIRAYACCRSTRTGEVVFLPRLRHRLDSNASHLR